MALPNLLHICLDDAYTATTGSDNGVQSRNQLYGNYIRFEFFFALFCVDKPLQANISIFLTAMNFYT